LILIGVVFRQDFKTVSEDGLGVIRGVFGPVFGGLLATIAEQHWS